MKNKFITIIILNILLNAKFTLDDMYIQLDVNQTILKQNIVPEQNELISIGINSLGKEIFLSKKCASAWTKMQTDAKKDSIQMTIVSGFRSYAKQYAIINYKLQQGLKLDVILKENKLPGLSQHHSGNAIDIVSNSYKLSVDFEQSLAYSWLLNNAHKYGFYLTYPKDNKEGIMFEPWHWYFKE